MINITDKVTRAKEKDVLWRPSEFNSFLQWLNRDKQLTLSYWDDEENWASLLRGGVILGYIWNRYPLIFIDKSESNLISLINKSWAYIEIVPVSKLYHAELTLDEHKAIELFKVELDDVVSAEEIWFKTN